MIHSNVHLFSFACYTNIFNIFNRIPIWDMVTVYDRASFALEIHKIYNIFKYFTNLLISCTYYKYVRYLYSCLYKYKIMEFILLITIRADKIFFSFLCLFGFHYFFILIKKKVSKNMKTTLINLFLKINE